MERPLFRLVVLLSTMVSPHFLWGCQIEKKLIFFPDSRVSATPRDLGLAFDDVFFTTRDGVRLNGWFVPYSDRQPTLLWFHGNAGNISHRLENIKLLHERVNVNIFIFDYRGYGRSEGTVSEEGTYMDAEAAAAHLQQRYGITPERLVLFGRSLGAAVATEMATRMEPLAVILEGPFASIRDMARDMFPFLPVSLFLATRYDVVEKIGRIRAPLLVLHGEFDEIVPISQGRKVFDAAPQPKAFYTIARAGHNDTYRVGGDPYFAAFRKHIEGAIARRNAS
jgi:fermentation-respiration switch protein FrsA (DUF1100 family)